MNTKQNLPPLNVPVLAQCERINGNIETHYIRRIPAKEIASGWQWSSVYMRTYFALKVLSWKYVDDSPKIN